MPSDKKVKSSKQEKKQEVSETVDVDAKKGVRSFKALLPGETEFSGRFTGKTPYQAGNKALSKYYKLNKDASGDTITLKIRESTRKSNRGVYVYEGSRTKLDEPVVYKITDKATGKETVITKEFKNHLKKQKKSELEGEDSAATTKTTKGGKAKGAKKETKSGKKETKSEKKSAKSEKKETKSEKKETKSAKSSKKETKSTKTQKGGKSKSANASA